MKSNMNITEAKKILKHVKKLKGGYLLTVDKDYINELLEAQRVVLINEIVELSDTIELRHDTEFEEWKAFKGFRNTLTDRYINKVE